MKSNTDIVQLNDESMASIGVQQDPNASDDDSQDDGLVVRSLNQRRGTGTKIKKVSADGDDSS